MGPAFGARATTLVARARIGGATYIGNYGMERGWLRRRGRLSGISVEVVETAEAHTALADRLAAEVPRLVAGALARGGCTVEVGGVPISVRPPTWAGLRAQVRAAVGRHRSG